MKISVVIPAYNAAATIEATLDSVLRQTVQPDEILVLDDGSTDETSSVLHAYKQRITVLRQENRGVASALNALCGQAQGDLVAILGSDDIWHAGYLEMQSRLFGSYPTASALFTGHVDFYGEDNYEWVGDPLEPAADVELITSVTFLKRYNEAPGPFSNMSHCCVPGRVLRMLGGEPFKLRMAEDLYFFNRLFLFAAGPVVYISTPLVAYRIREGSLSSNRLVLNEAEVRVFELLDKDFCSNSGVAFRRVFREGFAIKRRQYAKVLLGAGEASKARRQLWCSLRDSRQPASFAKSMALLLIAALPRSLQPSWPPIYRNFRGPAGTGKPDVPMPDKGVLKCSSKQIRIM